MKYSLLNYIRCSYCRGDLSCIALAPAGNGSETGGGYVMTDTPADFPAEIETGLLVCGECGHWFPIYRFIPELLPDHLRNWQGDLEFFKTLESTLPGALYNELLAHSQRFSRPSAAGVDSGITYKQSEISISDKITDPDFYGPGYVAPFNPGNTDYTMHLIRRLGNTLPLLELKQGDVILDIGAGYAWTTEWLMKMGVESIGVDICRTYLDIGVKRMGDYRPHLVVADIENLPIKDHSLNGVLCYDAFHHIPDRKKSMANFYNALKDYGNIVLAEPDGSHELAAVSREVMDKYGILEKGIDLDELEEYCEGLQVLPPEQHFLLKINRNETDMALASEFIKSHIYMECNLLLVKKRVGERERVATTTTIKRKIKRHLKRILNRVFFRLLH